MGRSNWFEISNEGWRRLNAGRSLGSLLKEAVQNSLDEGVRTLDVTLGEEVIVVEDDSPRGFSNERLIYTVFLTDKEDSPTKRGRKGRGLKELISAMSSAVVETMGRSVYFDASGRHAEPNDRTEGTRVALWRAFAEPELRAAARELAMIIPPKETTLRVDGHRIRPPRLYLVLSPCYLETVVVRGGVERVVERAAELRLYIPRRGERPHLFEMGIPVDEVQLPWHVDVQQRVPLGDHRNVVGDDYKLSIKALLFESLVARHLDRRDLKADWVQEVLARTTPSSAALDAYISKLYERNSLLGGTTRANDRARQLGASIVDVGSMPQGVYATLSSVLESADDYVLRKEAEFNERPISPNSRQRAFGRFAEELGRLLIHTDVAVEFVRKEATLDGLVEDASYDRDSRTLRFNILGKCNFEDPMEPRTLGILFHEFAHHNAAEHDHRFIDRLQTLAGRGARLLSDNRTRDRLLELLKGP